MNTKCDRCKEPATVHLIEIKGGAKTEKHLCERHALEEGVGVKATPEPLHDLLKSFVLKPPAAGEATQLRCTDCGMTYDEFRRIGLLGCPECYAAFESVLSPLLERAHEGESRHIGKVPSRAGLDELRQQRLRQLRRELDEAVASEQYERAAELRDRLSHEESEP